VNDRGRLEASRLRAEFRRNSLKSQALGDPVRTNSAHHPSDEKLIQL
jgi:hypothetical protein